MSATEPLTCAQCGREMRRLPASLPQGQARCQPCRGWQSAITREDVHKHPKRDVPCAECGTLMWRGGKSGAVPGRSRCLPCRRAARDRARIVRTDRPCGMCGEMMLSARPDRKWCSKACADRSRRASFRPPTPEEKERRRQLEALRREERRKRGNVYHTTQWRKLRERVRLEESHCHLCGELIDFARQWPDRWAFVVDHVVPLSAGGAAFDRENVRAAHAFCNGSKGAREVYAA